MEQAAKKKKRKKIMPQPVASAKPCGYIHFIPLPKNQNNESKQPVFADR